MSPEHNLGEGRSRPQNMSEALRLLSSVIRPKGDPPGAHPKSEFINTKAAAQWLGIPERSMQQYVQMGLLPSYKLGKHRLFRKNELLEALGATRRAFGSPIKLSLFEGKEGAFLPPQPTNPSTAYRTA